jgi:hypothetical protein
MACRLKNTRLIRGYSELPSRNFFRAFFQRQTKAMPLDQV